MSAWLLPAATAAWWAGLLLGFGPARSWVVWAPGVLGLAAIVSAAIAAPATRGRDPVAEAGLVPNARRPVTAVERISAPRRGRRGIRPSPLTLLVCTGVCARGRLLGAAHATTSGDVAARGTGSRSGRGRRHAARGSAPRRARMARARRRPPRAHGRRRGERAARDGLALRRRGSARRPPAATSSGPRARSRCPTTRGSSTRSTPRASRSRCVRRRSSGSTAPRTRSSERPRPCGRRWRGRSRRCSPREKPGCSWASRSATTRSSTPASNATSRPPGSRTCSSSPAATSRWCSARSLALVTMLGLPEGRPGGGRPRDGRVHRRAHRRGAVGDARRRDGRAHPRRSAPRPRPFDRRRALGRGARAADPAAGAGAIDRLPALRHGDRRHGGDGRPAGRAVRPRDARARRGGGGHDARGPARRDARPAVPLPRRAGGHAARERGRRARRWRRRCCSGSWRPGWASSRSRSVTSSGSRPRRRCEPCS